MSRYRILALISAVVIVADQATKIYIDSRFALYESVTVVENFFNITHVRNPGAAFGFLSDHALRLPFFIAVAALASIGIVWYMSRLREDQRLMHVSLSLVLAGAVGNLIDRIRLGEVIDFLDVHWYNLYHWPAFNVADAAITVGVALLLIATWREERQAKKSS